MTLVDSHCHLGDKRFNSDRAQAIERALEAGVERMVVIDDPALAETHEALFATVGIHPHNAAQADLSACRRLAEMLSHPKVVALGEIGLDYHYNFSPPEQQRVVFIEQMRVARDARKPIVIHTREAWEDTFRLLEEHWAPAGLSGIMHCFSGGPEEARRSMELGFYLAFGGILTYPNAVDVQQAARVTPLDRLLVETDAPYLAPVPHRGKRNEPAFVLHTARKLAELRGESLDQLAAATTANFHRLCLPAA